MKQLTLFFIVSTFLFASPIDAQQTTNKALAVRILSENSVSLKDLPLGAIKVTEDKKPQTVTAFKPDETPVSIGFLFDASKSFTDGETQSADVVRSAFLDLLSNADSSNEYFIMNFARTAQIVTDWTNSKDKIVEGLNKSSLSSEKCGYQCSAIFDAYFTAIEKLSTGKNKRRILIAVTDAVNLDSKHSEKELKRLAREKDVTIYTLIPSMPNRILTDSKILFDISTLSGGSAFSFSDAHRLAPKFERKRLETTCRNIFSYISRSLRSRYEITYQSPDNFADNKPHKIKVEINLPPELKKQTGKLQILHRPE